MVLKTSTRFAIPADLLEAIRSLSTDREVEHCGLRFNVSPFDFYAHCPACGSQIKLRGFSGNMDIADLFDAVFAWMNLPGALAVAERRRQQIAADNGG